MYSKSGKPIKQCRGHVLCMVLTAYNGYLSGGGGVDLWSHTSRWWQLICSVALCLYLGVSIFWFIQR